MNFAAIGNQVKISITNNWEKVAVGYQVTVLPVVRVAFQALSHLTGPIGAHIILGGFSIGLFYIGHQVWHKKMGTWEENQQKVTVGPKNRVMQLMLRITGLCEMLLAATIAGGLVAIAGGTTALALGVTSGITLLGMLV